MEREQTMLEMQRRIEQLECEAREYAARRRLERLRLAVLSPVERLKLEAGTPSYDHGASLWARLAVRDEE